MAEHNEELIREAKRIIDQAREGIDKADVMWLKGQKEQAIVEINLAVNQLQNAKTVMRAIMRSMK
jgi:hypothetical protein